MARLFAKGIQAHLPAGFEGRIFQRPAVAGASTGTVAHFSTFPVPAGAGDFGGGATQVMKPADIFAVLFEYGQESTGRPLFARQGMPRDLTPGDFHPYVLRRGIPGQAGTQWFFTESGRPFTLYIVLGGYVRRASLVPRVNLLLHQITILPAPVTVTA